MELLLCDQPEVEIWKPVVGYEGYYEISNYGRIKRLKRIVQRYNKDYIVKEAILSVSYHKDKYLHLNLAIDKQRKKYLVHRLVALAFIPNPKNKPEVNHKNGIKTYNYWKNLEWNTGTENQKHAYLNKLKIPNYGEKNSAAKLSQKEVNEIRQLFKRESERKSNTKFLIKKFNVSKSTIYKIINYANWKN